MSGNKLVLLTGATGFIGSNIARKLLHDGFKVIATKRLSSSLVKCKDFVRQIRWVNLDDNHWPEVLHDIHPSILIHAAWDGIDETERNNWNIQLANFNVSKLLFNTAVECGVEKIIALGSQAEYGVYDKPYSESMVPAPVDAYGTIKLLTCNYLSIICQEKNIPWYWLRVFSVFGPGENASWLIPQVIMNLLKKQVILLTEGRQKYDYLFIEDLVISIIKIIQSKEINSGTYNICSGKAIEIKDLLMILTKLMKIPPEFLKFGALPYSNNQNMFMVGDPRKFESNFGNIEPGNMIKSLEKTINYYKNISED